MMCHMIKNCTIKPKLNLDKVFEVALMNGCGIWIKLPPLNCFLM